MTPPSFDLDPALRGPLERVLRLADDLAGAWGARARASTTLAIERAHLRLLGVGGLDRAGLPLASTVVERGIGPSHERLAGGITLPFAIALVEYDIPPLQLALDVASGAVDLGFEAELLAEPDRRATAEAEARRLVQVAFERIDVNRTARVDLAGILGEPPRPWLAATLAAPNLDAAPAEAARLVEAGADVVKVRTPAIRELVIRLHDRGLEPSEWWPRGDGDADTDPATVPAGSQRALAVLRVAVDEAAAEERRYVRMATAAPALAAPEQALVAALERVDLVEADPLAEIVAGGVDPDRALADHAFARRLLGRAGVQVVLGPGPLIVAPDIARGIPSDPATRAGRAFALQAIGIALARGDGLRPGQLLAGALVPWLAEEADPLTQALAQVIVRRTAWPEIPLVFEEPDLPPRAAARWPFLLAIGLAAARGGAVVSRTAAAVGLGRAVEQTRAAAAIAAELSEVGPGARGGPAVRHASALLAAATTTLEQLGDEGWRSILGDPLGGPSRDRLGADAVVERSETFDALELELAGN